MTNICLIPSKITTATTQLCAKCKLILSAITFCAGLSVQEVIYKVSSRTPTPSPKKKFLKEVASISVAFSFSNNTETQAIDRLNEHLFRLSFFEKGRQTQRFYMTVLNYISLFLLPQQTQPPSDSTFGRVLLACKDASTKYRMTKLTTYVFRTAYAECADNPTAFAGFLLYAFNHESIISAEGHDGAYNYFLESYNKYLLRHIFSSFNFNVKDVDEIYTSLLEYLG